jgi:glycosyltransferase involved in cell wall biosynthesis
MIDNESVDVILCTWNSNKVYFEKVLLSIKKEVNIHHLIVVDRYSTDGTLDAVQSIFPEARIFQTAANLAIARKIGIEQVDTEYFAFIDDDIEISRGWFTSMISFIRRRSWVGAVQGSVRYDACHMGKARSFELARRRGEATEISERGYTHNTLLRTGTVKDFDPPKMVHSWEDFLITQHVINKGYKWFKTNHAQASHFRKADRRFLGELHENVLRARWNGAGERLVHLNRSSYTRQIGRLLLDSFKSILYNSAVGIFFLDPGIPLLALTGQLGYLDGFLSAKDHIVPYELHMLRR